MSQPIILGVAGGSGSGKTTIVREIVQALGPDRISVIHHDSYYCDRSSVPAEERESLNYDHPDALETRLLVRHLEELRAGRAVEVPVYDFSTHTRTERVEHVQPRSIVIVEGILILAERALRELMDIRVFVRTDADLRVIRRIERDVAQRERSLESVVEQYVKTVRPMHLEFVEPSERWAHVIIPEGGHNRVGVEMLIARIRALGSES
ncbi:MAG: uridine kinase [Gemmatimonadetes bacterium]|nr:uridine kinase [Gemmatimonadota bacterium]